MIVGDGGGMPRATSRRGLTGAANARIVATSPGGAATATAIRKAASHLPATIDRVDSGVAISRSRVRRSRSSASEAGARTLRSNSPSDGSKPIAAAINGPPAGSGVPGCSATNVASPNTAIEPAQ